MAQQTTPDPLPPELEDDDREDMRAASRGRPEYVIAFGVVALVAMIFGFLLGLLF